MMGHGSLKETSMIGAITSGLVILSLFAFPSGLELAKQRDFNPTAIIPQPFLASIASSAAKSRAFNTTKEVNLPPTPEIEHRNTAFSTNYDLLRSLDRVWPRPLPEIISFKSSIARLPEVTFEVIPREEAVSWLDASELYPTSQ